MNRAQTGPLFTLRIREELVVEGWGKVFVAEKSPSPALSCSHSPYSISLSFTYYCCNHNSLSIPLSFLLLLQPQPRLIPLYFLHYKWYGWLVYVGCLRGLGVYHPPHLHHNNPSTPTTHLHNLAKPEPQVANEVIRRRSSGKWSRPPP